jgi:hypothetical protein
VPADSQRQEPAGLFPRPQLPLGRFQDNHVDAMATEENARTWRRHCLADHRDFVGTIKEAAN